MKISESACGGGSGEVKVAGSCYKSQGSNKQFYEAVQLCQDNNAELATFEGLTNDATLLTIMPVSTAFHVGATRVHLFWGHNGAILMCF